MHDFSLKTTFTLAEAADLLSCHKETLRRAIQSGELQAAKLGRGYRLSRVDLESFWTANGGGELFPAGSGVSKSFVAETGSGAKKAKKKENAEQLSLFST